MAGAFIHADFSRSECSLERALEALVVGRGRHLARDGPRSYSVLPSPGPFARHAGSNRVGCAVRNVDALLDVNRTSSMDVVLGLVVRDSVDLVLDSREPVAARIHQVEIRIHLPTRPLDARPHVIQLKIGYLDIGRTGNSQ